MVKAKKSLGQNFLKDQSILKRIIEAGEVSKDDLVVEIGPGKAALTKHLLDHAGRVIAVELDEYLAHKLTEQFTQENFEIIHGDALDYSPPKKAYKLIANIPYYISSPLINHFLLEQFQHGNPPSLIVIMIQKEVAEKIIAGNKKHSVLSLQVHLFGEPELICIVPPEAFEPSPKVESAVIKITVNKKPKIDLDTKKDELKKLFWLFHMSFAQKRKKLSNNLANAFKKTPAEIRGILQRIGIHEAARAEELSLQEWEKLFNEFIRNEQN